ncbi:hypothetical protein RV02_GL000354 [Enterococcus gilvus]|nr:hypothetical protein RV02_GL000354 [Enterococcus gilvus]
MRNEKSESGLKKLPKYKAECRFTFDSESKSTFGFPLFILLYL